MPTDTDIWTDIQWCKSHFRVIAEGGVWGVPRSGLVFQKSNGTLWLFDVMPYDPNMPITQDQLIEQQKADFGLIKARFERAEIPVKRWPAKQFWEETEPPGAGADPYGRPDPRTHPEYWTE